MGQNALARVGLWGTEISPRMNLRKPLLVSRSWTLFLARLADAHSAGRLAFFGEIEGLRCWKVFTTRLAPLRRKNWFVYAKPPFAGPEAVLAYLARYTHRVCHLKQPPGRLDERGIPSATRTTAATAGSGFAR